MSKYLIGDLTITAAETEMFDSGDYNYSVTLETNGKRFVIIESTISVTSGGSA